MLNITRLQSQAPLGAHSRIVLHPYSPSRSVSGCKSARSVIGRAATRLMVTAADKQTVRLLSPLFPCPPCGNNRHAPTPVCCSHELSQLRQVLVTGAGGRTGKLVSQKLLGRPEHFEARGLVRTAEVGLPTTTVVASAYRTALAANTPLLWFVVVICACRRGCSCRAAACCRFTSIL